MIVVAVLGILAAIGIARYQELIRKSEEASTRNNLGTLRSALHIYYGATEGKYPQDDLASLQPQYLKEMPLLKSDRSHANSRQVTVETSPSDAGTWSYDSTEGSNDWGHVAIGCTHSDLRQTIWSTY